jgi:general secretion pathway protein L
MRSPRIEQRRMFSARLSRGEAHKLHESRARSPDECLGEISAFGSPEVRRLVLAWLAPSMSMSGNINARFWRVMDEAASAALGVGRVFGGARPLQLVETETDTFELRPASGKAAFAGSLRFVDGRIVEAPPSGMTSRLAGADVEITLAQGRFLFRTLELPEKAGGFLDAIVAGQIDRLTPWSPTQAAFGRGVPASLPGGRLGVTVAAISRSRIAPLVNAIETFKPAAISVSAPLQAQTARVVVLARQANREGRLRRMRGRLMAGLVVAGATAAASLALWIDIGGAAATSRDDIAREISERRAALASRRGFVDDATTALNERKRQSAPSVMVMEKLSRALPDDVYLTGLKITDGKLEISGVAKAAAPLIQILEQTDMFRHATFSAPTTQAPAEENERFQIEAQIQPTALVAP